MNYAQRLLTIGLLDLQDRFRTLLEQPESKPRNTELFIVQRRIEEVEEGLKLLQQVHC